MTAPGPDVAAQLAALTKEVAALRKSVRAFPRVAEIFYSAGWHDAGGTGDPNVLKSVYRLGVETGRQGLFPGTPAAKEPARSRPRRRHLKAVSPIGGKP